MVSISFINHLNELYRYNASIFWCQKGCDFAKGRMSDDIKRIEADNMCKMMA